MAQALAGHVPYMCASSTVGRPAGAMGAFILNGASDPTQVAGVVDSVRRLVDGSARPFFRVKFNTMMPLRALSTAISPHVRGTAITDELTTNIVDVTASPAATRDDAFELDIIVLNAGVPVDTADFRVELVLHYGRERPVEVA